MRSKLEYCDQNLNLVPEDRIGNISTYVFLFCYQFDLNAESWIRYPKPNRTT